MTPYLIPSPLTNQHGSRIPPLLECVEGNSTAAPSELQGSIWPPSTSPCHERCTSCPDIHMMAPACQQPMQMHSLSPSIDEVCREKMEGVPGETEVVENYSEDIDVSVGNGSEG